MTWTPVHWPTPSQLDVSAARIDFPILARTLPSGKPLIYLDNSATTQKPQQVINAMSEYYENSNSNVHRAAHTLASEATQSYEDSREKLRHWFSAQDSKVVFTSGTTEAINLVAHSWG